MKKMNKYPLIITKDIQVFPEISSAFLVTESFSLVALSHATSEYNGEVVVVAQKDIYDAKNIGKSIYSIGTLCKVKGYYNETENSLKINLTGEKRVHILSVHQLGEGEISFYEVSVEDYPSIPIESKEKEEKLISSLQGMLNNVRTIEMATLRKGFVQFKSLEAILDYFVLSIPKFDGKTRQLFLENRSVEERYNLMKDYLENEKIRYKVMDEVEKDVQKRAQDAQQEYFLREQMKSIQKKLNEISGEEDENEEILKKIDSDLYPSNIQDRIRSELKKLDQLPAGSLEASMLKSYIQWLVDLPWTQKTVDNNSLPNAQKVLNEDHYGLEKVKERIIEYLAVKSMTNSLKAPIICLYGPPGVGKTSLAKSVARALGRKFVKASLGGVSDESEIRGHRRTYVASMPGKIIKGIKNAGVCNPVFLLDEIDKLTSNIHGDPASALLEVLDPEQNVVFQDNYLEETYDLSNVLFICTANYLENIPAALRDRLELIELNTYTEIEKLHIATEHLIQKQCTANGLKDTQISFDDEAILQIIRYYTREAGVRELERKIATCCRKAIVELISNPRKRKITVNKKKIKDYLGTEIFDYSQHLKKSTIGVVTGLAYTQFGGDILPIEVNYFNGKGGLILTGNLGNVMKESASIALDYVKANAQRYGINKDFFMKHDIHIHVPEGAVPKDGPSAGIAITVAIVSAVKKIPSKASVAMTGEVNLRGEALPIGGLKEKTLAALRSGITTVLVPKENNRNIEDLPEEVKNGLRIVRIHNVEDALKETLTQYDFL